MKRFSKQLGKAVNKVETRIPKVDQKEGDKIPQDTEGFLKSVGGAIAFATETVWDTGKTAVSWADQPMSCGYSLLSEGISSSKVIAVSTGKEILKYVSSAYKSSFNTGEKVVNLTTILINAILASDFSRNMESWLGKMFNEGIPSIYDAAADAVYNATRIGGPTLHRWFDGSHTLWGMWSKVRGASPDDTFLQEVVGYATALGKDLSSYVGIPLFTWSKSSYDKVSNALSTTFNIPKPWFTDLCHVNATELVGVSIATIAVALNWNKKQVKEFASLAGSLGIVSVASANPILVIVALVTLAKSFVDAKQKGNYSEFVNGLVKGGVGTGIFLATASAIGGPVWVGILAGLCVGAVVHKTMDNVDISQIVSFAEKSLRKAVGQLKESKQLFAIYGKKQCYEG